VYLSECQQEFPIISDYLTGRLLWFIFVLGNLLLHLQTVDFTRAHHSNARSTDKPEQLYLFLDCKTSSFAKTSEWIC